MQRKSLAILLLLLLGCLSGCGPTPPPKPKLNSLQIEAMQTQEFNAPKRKTFDAVMTVLQNDGYVIQAANYDTGFITAKSSTRSTPFVKTDDDSESMNNGEQMAIGIGMAALIGVAAGGHGGIYVGGGTGSQHVTYAETITAFVNPIQSAKQTTTKVRLSFVQNKVTSDRGTNKD
ncbi:MAG: hypothetical protein KAT71_04210, partial [Gammaproteobacteria bacterium]|nr:hypothetical protein [Gammaproteobacteria bacterium]